MKIVNLRGKKKEHNCNNKVINSVRQSFTKVTSFPDNERKKLRLTETTKVLFLVKDYSFFCTLISVSLIFYKASYS